MDKEKSKVQTKILIGTGLIILGLLIVIFALRTPIVNTSGEEVSVSLTTATDATTEITTKATTESTTALPDYPLDINNATAEELMTIEGIGEHKAKLIVAYREQIGKYTSIYQLTNIKGFTPEYVKNIEAYLTV